MTIINSATDIRTYAANMSPANCVEADSVEAVARAIQAADHPPYGEDWSLWLEEHAEPIALSAMQRPAKEL
jgi:hypothetical protein